MPRPAEETKLPEPIKEANRWLVRLRGDSLSEAETHAFADWLSQDALHAEAFAKAEELFNDMVIVSQLHRTTTLSPANTDSKHSKSQSLSRHNNRRWLALPLALAAAWLFAVGLVLPNQAHLLDAYLSDYHTKTGEFRDIQLTDGSRLLLNTNTAVSVDYQASKRQITLHHGQVRFTVAKDAQRPFEVTADGLNVRALGTFFEVYRKASDSITVTVQEHAVAAQIQEDSQKATEGTPTQVEVKAGQQLTYNADGMLHQPTDVDLNQASAWQQHRLFINDRPLGELIAELERYRAGRIFLADTQLKNLRVTGVFTLNNPDEVLTRMRKILGLQETRLGSWWVLLHR
jgi:transmembrane sensor